MISVIVIDDQPLEGKMVAYTLERSCPYATYEGQAYNAREGVALAERKQPDVIFLDITMPGTDGITAIADLRRVSPRSAIVMLTAYDDFEYVRAAMRAGANDYLLKPTRPKDVVDAVDRWSGKRGSAEDPIEAAKRYVEEHLDQSITLADMAGRLFLSPAYFSRLFKVRTGSTFSSWVAQRRVAMGMRYLEETDMSIADISARVGYQEANSFTRLFKQAVGLSPTEYRKRRGAPGK